MTMTAAGCESRALGKRNQRGEATANAAIAYGVLA